MAEYIEREALRKALIKHFDAVYDDGKLVFSDHICTAEDCEDILKLVAELPTADVVPVEWISVKDRLPETNGKYLVAYYSMQFKRYFLDLLYYDARNKDEYFYCAENYKQKVDYWMPLPEPPKKEVAQNEQ